MTAQVVIAPLAARTNTLRNEMAEVDALLHTELSEFHGTLTQRAVMTPTNNPQSLQAHIERTHDVLDQLRDLRDALTTHQ